MPLEDLPIPKPDPNALEAMVNRYACKECPRYGATIDPGPRGERALRELLLEIDQTMLPRRILVQCPPHADLALFVSNRRLFDIKTRGESLAQMPLSPKDAARVFASLMRRAAQDCAGLVLQNPQALGQFDDVGVSVSTALLADVLGLRDGAELTPSVEEAPEDFKVIRDAARSSLLATPSLSFSHAHGSEAEIARLQSFWRDYVKRSGLESTRSRIKHHCRDCIVVPIDHDTHLVVATKDEELWCLAIIPRSHVHALTTDWGALPS